MSVWLNAVRYSLARYGDLFAAGFLMLVALYFGSNLFSPIRFDRERIEIEATNEGIHVFGLYHYQNRFSLPVSFSLGLPFPVDATHLAPLNCSVSESTSEGEPINKVNVHKYHGDVVFRLWFKPSQEKWIRIDYTQPILASNARYILLTTQKWRRSLGTGQYILHLEKGAALESSNYDLQYSVHGQTVTYTFVRSNFLPSQDWLFSWRPAAPLVASKQEPK